MSAADLADLARSKPNHFDWTVDLIYLDYNSTVDYLSRHQRGYTYANIINFIGKLGGLHRFKHPRKDSGIQDSGIQGTSYLFCRVRE